MKVVKIVVGAILGIIIILFLYIWIPRILNPQLTIVKNASSENIDNLLSFYEIYLGQEKLNSLLMSISEKSIDSRSLLLVALYANNNSLCDFTTTLDDRYQYLKSLPSDTVWTTQITDDYARDSGVNGDFATDSFFKQFEELVQNCR